MLLLYVMVCLTVIGIKCTQVSAHVWRTFCIKCVCSDSECVLEKEFPVLSRGIKGYHFIDDVDPMPKYVMEIGQSSLSSILFHPLPGVRCFQTAAHFTL